CQPGTEVPCEVGCGRHVCGKCGQAGVAEAFERREEKRLVSSIKHLGDVNRSADCETVLVLVIGVARNALKDAVGIIRVHARVLESVIDAAMETVGPGL